MKNLLHFFQLNMCFFFECQNHEMFRIPTLIFLQSGHDMCSFCCPLKSGEKIEEKVGFGGCPPSLSECRQARDAQPETKGDVETGSTRWKGGDGAASL